MVILKGGHGMKCYYVQQVSLFNGKHYYKCQELQIGGENRLDKFPYPNAFHVLIPWSFLVQYKVKIVEHAIELNVPYKLTIGWQT
jgi:hypothetical protein